MPYTFGTLCQRNPSYDDATIKTLDALYVGGFQVMRTARDYLVRMIGEGQERYEHRIKLATYQPFFGQIVDQFASDLFAQNLELTPAADADKPLTPGEDTVDSYYTDFAKDADGQGHTFVDLLRCALTTALIQRRAIICVDAPQADAEPATRADEDAQGLSRLYAYELPLSCLIDWERDEDGGLVWAIVRKQTRPRLTPGASRGRIFDCFTVWTMGKDGKAAWQRFEIDYSPDKPPVDTAEVPLAAEGTTSFDAIPLHVLELPEGLWVGNKIGPLVLEHFRRRSALIGAQAASLCAIPVIARGPESGAVDGPMVSETQQNPHRGRDPVGSLVSRGWTETGKDDRVYFAEPEGKCYELVDKELKELRDDIFAVCHQMAASVKPTSKALGRSGLSKQKDQEATAKVLAALGRIVREFALSVYSCISAARGDEIAWTAHGLENYETEDREQLLEEALAAAQIPIPSPTFRKLHAFRLVGKLVPNATSQEFDVIRKEIDSGIDERQEADELAKAAVSEEAPKPPTPTIPQPPRAKPNGQSAAA